jgi:hypothetical protein
VLLVLTLSIVPLTAAAWVLNALFEPPRSYPTGAYPLDVAVADVDDDGNQDVLTANRDGRSISVLMGEGDGTLDPAEEILLDLGATSLALADMNGDGTVDIVASGCEPGCTNNSVTILHGSGDGRFEEGSVFSLDGVPYNVTVADFDRDDRPDIVASDYPGERILVLLSAWASEGFTVRSLPTGTKPIALRVGDLNLDGIPDIVSSDHGSGSSTVYLSHGGGEFSERIVVESGELPYSLALASVDRDKIPDLVVAHSTDPGRITVLQGRGDGTFTFRQDFEVVDRLVYVDLADFNDDGALDIIVTRDQEKFAGVFLNEGDGLFDDREIRVQAESKIYSLAVSNLDRDPFPDLVTVDYEQNTVSVSLGESPAGR